VQTLIQKAERCLAAVGVTLLLKEPFFAHVLSGLGRRFTNEIETMATCFRNSCYSVLINPAYFVHLLTEDERVALIKHELLHLILSHHLRRPLQPTWQQTFDIASDLVVNQLIQPWILPDDAWRISDFPGLTMTNDQTAEWYHERLKSMLLLPLHETERDSSSPQSSLSVVEANGEVKTDKKVACKNPEKRLPKTQRTILDKRCGKKRGLHTLWSEETELSTSMGLEENNLKSFHGQRILQQAKLQRVIKHAKIKVSPKQWGDMPAGLRREIDVVISEQSGLPWRRILRIFAMTSQQTRLISTHLRESRRFPGEAGNKIRPVGRKLAIAIDTSGSISDEVLMTFFREIQAIQLQKSQITLIQCDAEIQEISILRKNQIPELSGGGGTSFDPVFQWLKTNRRSRFGGCIYLTDGQGPPPEIDPECRILWVLTPEGQAGPQLRPGKVIQMK